MPRRPVVLLLAAAALAVEEGWVTHEVALSPDGKTAVRGRMHNETGAMRMQLLDAATGEVRVEFKSQGPIRSFAFAPDGKRYVASNDHGPLTVHETDSGRVVAKLPGHRGWVYSVALADGRVASAGRDDTLRLFDVAKEREIWKQEGVRIGRVAFAPDGRVLAATDRSGRALLFETATGKKLGELDVDDNRWSFEAVFSRDGGRIAFGSRRIVVFDVATRKRLVRIDVHPKKAATTIALSDDGALLATADSDRLVRVWRVADGKRLAEWKSELSVGALVFDAGARKLRAATYYGGCAAWTLPAEPKPKATPDAGTR